MKLSKPKIALLLIAIGYIPHLVWFIYLAFINPSPVDFVFKTLDIFKIIGYFLAVIASFVVALEVRSRMVKLKIPVSAKFLIPFFSFFATLSISWFCYTFLIFTLLMFGYGMSLGN